MFGTTFSHLDERFRLILMGSLVGACSALAAVALTRSLVWGTAVLAAYRDTLSGSLLPAGGAMLSVLVLHRVFREPGGHGVTEVVYSISRRGGLLRLRSAFSRLASSLLTIASGGSAGPEAPIVISGATIGSNLGNLFGTNDRQRYVVVGCGAAGAIAAIFNAPMAGIAFALEAILGEWRPVHVVPIAVASVTATEVSRLLEGNQIPFQHPVYGAGLLDLLASVGLGALCAATSLLLMWTMRKTGNAGRRALVSPVLRAGVGGLLVGGVALAFPVVLGEGYETVRAAIHGQFEGGIAIVGLAVVAKVAATSLTLGSGASGGVFAPCLVIGSLCGLFYRGVAAAVLPAAAVAPGGFFALLGMTGMVSSVLQAPLTGSFLVIEITGSYEIVAPVVLVAVVAATISHRFEPCSIYNRELEESGDLLRPRTDARVLADLALVEVMDSDPMVLPPEMPLRDLVALLKHSRERFFPVVRRPGGLFVGMVDAHSVRHLLLNPALYDSLLVEELVDPGHGSVEHSKNLAAIMGRFDAEGVSCLPVVKGHRLVGVVHRERVLEHYRKELIVQEDS